MVDNLVTWCIIIFKWDTQRSELKSNIQLQLAPVGREFQNVGVWHSVVAFRMSLGRRCCGNRLKYIKELVKNGCSFRKFGHNEGFNMVYFMFFRKPTSRNQYKWHIKSHKLLPPNFCTISSSHPLGNLIFGFLMSNWIHVLMLPHHV